MRGRATLLTLILLIAAGTTVHADPETHFELTLGYHLADFDWSVAGDLNGENPNILSELEWDSLGILEATVGTELVFRRKICLMGSFSMGAVISGDVRDSDYAGDNRTFEYSRSIADGGNDRVWGADLGVGYQFVLETMGGLPRRRLLLKAGYSRGDQELRMTGGVVVVSDPAIDPDAVPLGPFAGLNSTYDTEWDGPWIGAEFEHRIGKTMGILADVEFHWADYYGRANWNLRQDFAHPVSFEHWSDGTGIVLSLGGSWRRFTPGRFRLSLNVECWDTDPGLDRFYLDDGTFGETRLNGASWSSVSLLLGYDFNL